MTTYQRIKEENKKLKAELIEIAENPKSVKSAMILFNYRLLIEMEKQIFFGTSTTKGGNKTLKAMK
jgi:hypothetical protein